MEAQATLQLEATGQRLWTTGQVVLATVIAGPAGGLYFAGRNFAAMGRFDDAKKFYLIAVLIALLYGTLLFFFERYSVGAYAGAIGAMMGMMRTYQKSAIESMLQAGARRYSYWWCLLVAFCFSVVQMPLFFVYGALLGYYF